MQRMYVHELGLENVGVMKKEVCRRFWMIWLIGVKIRRGSACERHGSE